MEGQVRTQKRRGEHLLRKRSVDPVFPKNKFFFFFVCAWNKSPLIEKCTVLKALCAGCDLVLFHPLDTGGKFDVVLCLVLFIWFQCLAAGPAYSRRRRNLPRVWEQPLRPAVCSRDARCPLHERCEPKYQTNRYSREIWEFYFLFTTLFLQNWIIIKPCRHLFDCICRLRGKPHTAAGCNHIQEINELRRAVNWSGKPPRYPEQLSHPALPPAPRKRQIIGFYGGCQPHAILDEQRTEFQCGKMVPSLSRPSEQGGRTLQSPCVQMWLINCARCEGRRWCV